MGLRFLFCAGLKSLFLLSFPIGSTALPLHSLPLLSSQGGAQGASASEMLPLLLPLLWAGEWPQGEGLWG